MTDITSPRANAKPRDPLERLAHCLLVWQRGGYLPTAAPHRRRDQPERRKLVATCPC